MKQWQGDHALANANRSKNLRQVQSSREKPCFPFYLLSEPVADQLYTVTDVKGTQTFKRWTPFPSHCPLAYEYRLMETDSDVSEVISINDNVITFYSTNTALFNYYAERNVTVFVKGVIGDKVKMFAEVTFKLTLRNPCFNSSFFDLVPSIFPAIATYRVFEPERVVQLGKF